MGLLRLSILALVLGCSSKAPPPKSPEPPTNQAAGEPAAEEKLVANPAPADDPPPPEEEDKPDDGAPPQKPASVTAAHLKTADAVLALMVKLGVDMQAAGSDCKAAAKVITAASKSIAKLKPDIDKLEALTKSDAQAKAWFDANYLSKMMTALGPLMSLAGTCGKDPDFQAAMKSMDAA